jgi:hypothetical protein
MGKKYVPSPPITDVRVECKHHVAYVHCPTCNPKK